MFLCMPLKIGLKIRYFRVCSKTRNRAEKNRNFDWRNIFDQNFPNSHDLFKLIKLIQSNFISSLLSREFSNQQHQSQKICHFIFTLEMLTEWEFYFFFVDETNFLFKKITQTSKSMNPCRVVQSTKLMVRIWFKLQNCVTNSRPKRNQ